MEKTTFITLARTKFTLTEKADYLMTDYMKFLKKRVLNQEQMEDIESQMAYIFTSESEGEDLPITEKIVWSAINVVATNEKIYYKFSEKRDQNFFTQKEEKQKRRNAFNSGEKNKKDKLFLGVCLYFANNLGINVYLIRALFAIIIFFTHWTIAIYFILYYVLRKSERLAKKSETTPFNS